MKLYVCMLYVWYYWNEKRHICECSTLDIIKMSLYISENCMYDIIKVWGVSECSEHDIIKTRGGIWLYMILLKLEVINVWMLFIWYY